jgi:hypothetical protein
MSSQAVQPVVGGIHSEFLSTKVSKQARKCTKNLTFRRVCVTIVSVETQEILRIQSVCS